MVFTLRDNSCEIILIALYNDDNVRLFAHPGIVKARYHDSGILPGQERGKIRRITGVNEYGSSRPEVLQPFRRPSLRRLGLDRMLEENRIDHIKTRSQGVVGLAFPTPRIQPERTVPLEQTQCHCDYRGTADDADPDPSIERLHERVDGRIALLLRNHDRVSGIEIRISEVDHA